MNHYWRIRIEGKQRKDVDVGLLVQALLQFVRELEAKESDTAPAPPDSNDACE